MSTPALKLSRGKRRMSYIRRLKGRVQGNHQEAGFFSLVDGRRQSLRVRRRDQNPLRARGNTGLDRGDLGLDVAIRFACKGAQFYAMSVRGFLRALAHFHKKKDSSPSS